MAEHFRQSGLRPIPSTAPQSLELLCIDGRILADVRNLLAPFVAVDTETGHWPWGELTGKPGQAKNTFAAVYRVLADKGLSLKLEGPARRKIFVADISLRMANYDIKGQTSSVFHDYYAGVLRWVKVWQAKHEANL